MEKVKQTDDYIIYQKRSKRYAIRDNNRKWIQGEEKVKILVSEKLIKVAAPKPKEEPKEEATASEETAAPAEEAKSE